MQREELELFWAEMSDVKPLNSTDSIYLPTNRLNDSACQARRQSVTLDERLERLALIPAQLVRRQSDEQVSFGRDGVQQGVLKQLRLGKYHIRSCYDFRHLRLSAARELLLQIIDGAIERGERCVLLISGTGVGSRPFNALMKSALCTWLEQLTEVHAFHSAIPKDGGCGALYVMLQKSAADKLHSFETNRKGARS